MYSNRVLTKNSYFVFLMAQRYTNRLAKEKSSYLQQHANNPVDWYAWGNEAFKKAKDENKPIFLSIGYSTCHWCHVMEHESFENPEIADILNKYFVSIKVDREERPDVDRVYMTYLQATQEGGGWPLSCFLTSKLQPFFAGTYFPPDTRYYGRPGFKQLLTSIKDTWDKKRDEIEKGSSGTINQLNEALSATSIASNLPSTNCILTCFKYFANDFDDLHAGFGTKPKFPQPVNLTFLLTCASLSHQKGEDPSIAQLAVDMVKTTLKQMSLGGINDQLGKGFHRYSTDEKWHVPHFEKMLYDNAQLATSYADTYAITKDELHAQTLRDILFYVEHYLRHEQGGFYSAEDADSLPTKEAKKKKEGAFYAWHYDDLQKLLSEKISDHTHADVFCHYFQCKKNGNVDPMQDPHDELKHQNILITNGDTEATAKHFNITKAEVEQILDQSKQILLKHREQRPRPHRDEKILAAWQVIR
ncbi:unnamed protein product [Didymodactylos carnosus]|uniref:Spermatogenesis-associated protein 20-like TRX domain-containing protein n=1 Tax=Didymodactylos carnosus TaxID=1234261 RepID=A0A814FI86_9BILA|nr:unnamed protein product [Didymodactylos carnosus]CAF0980405.1 unnamed protein product [Didymodactylos carnosus]CAF3626134.1 unnamed protein product [Didymodactylos carnosus]CAF3752956.1 unnamed protein product [Didymodactylos carnosus]